VMFTALKKFVLITFIIPSALSQKFIVTPMSEQAVAAAKMNE